MATTARPEAARRLAVRILLGVVGAGLAGVVAAQSSRSPDPRADLRHVAPERTPGRLTCEFDLPGGGGVAQEYLSDYAGRGYVVAPWLGLREIYTDNVRLEPDDEAESAFVTGVIPGLSICGAGRRSSASINYHAEGYYYSHNADKEVFHSLDATGELALLRQRLFINAFARQRQTVIDPSERFSADNALDVSGNRTDELVYGIGPTWREELGNLGFATLRYTYRQTEYGEEEFIDTTSHSASLSLDSGPAREDVTWQARVSTERLERDAEPDHRYYDEAFLDLGVRLISHLSLVGRGGLESDFEDDQDTDRFGASFWNVGLRWRGSRTEWEARAGERFFGESYSLSLRRMGPHLTLALNASETPEEVSRLEDFSRLAPTETIVVDPETGETTRLLTGLDNTEVFLRRRLGLTANYQIGHSSFALRGSAEERDFINTDATEWAERVSFEWRWARFNRTRIVPGWHWEHAQFDDGRDDYRRRYEIAVERLLSRRLQGAVSLRHQEQHSSAPGNDYQENAISVELARMF